MTMMRKVKLGVMGMKRGGMIIEYCKKAENAQVVAVCDRFVGRLEAAKKAHNDSSITYYTEFDEFIEHDMDAVVLANYATEHAPFAIKCLRKGIPVYSECLPCQTMKEAVELIEAVEETGTLYAYGENYCYLPVTKEMHRLFSEGRLGEFEYGEGEYLHNLDDAWHLHTLGDPNHWRNTMYATFYCTHSIGPLIHIAGKRPVSVVAFEMPNNERMKKMGAKGGHSALEIITLESGAVIKSLHGVGCSSNSNWYCAYGHEGRIESAREDAGTGDVTRVYVHKTRENPNLLGTDYLPKDELEDTSQFFGHGGSDFYSVYNFVEKVRGNEQAEIIDVYETMDMFLPGLLGYRSILNGNAPMEIPNLRDRAVRERYRNDTACVDPDVAGDQLLPSYSKGNPDIPDSVYEGLRERLEQEKKRPKQLKMIAFPKLQLPVGLPEGYRLTRYTGSEEEQDAWVEICKNGLLPIDASRENFRKSILNWSGIKPLEDVFFLEHEGRKVATVTAIDRVENGMGYVHMVAVRPEYRGKGLGSCLARIAVNKLTLNQCRMAYLTTTEDRKAACRSYLSVGFYPVNYKEDMPARWAKLIGELGMKSVQMLTDNGEPDKVILAEADRR